jgi:CRP-like cAMP-binding protein
LRELSLEDRLRTHQLFAGLESEIVRRLASMAQAYEFESGEYLWKQGEDTEALYLITSGRIDLEILIPHQGPLQIDTVGPGEVIGCSWVVAPYRWHFDARAVQNASVVVLEGDGLRRQCDDEPVLGYEVLKRLTRFLELRLQKTRLRILELHGH